MPSALDGAGMHAAIAIWVGVEHYFPRLFPWHLGGALEWIVGHALPGVLGVVVGALVVGLLEGFKAAKARLAAS